MNSREIGVIGEDIACDFLKKRGFTILTRNFAIKHGEIDIIAQKGRTIHFVEVKSVSREMSADGVSRETSKYRPEEKVHPGKLAKIRRVAEYYLAQHSPGMPAQIDVVAVLLDSSTRRAYCRVIENAGFT